MLILSWVKPLALLVFILVFSIKENSKTLLQKKDTSHSGLVDWLQRINTIMFIILIDIDTKNHYKNKPIQIYWKFYHQKFEVSDKNSYIFHISAKNINCGYLLEPPRGGGSNKYPQFMFLAEIRKIMYTPINPSFAIQKWGSRGSKLYRHVFVMNNKQKKTKQKKTKKNNKVKWPLLHNFSMVILSWIY